MKPTIKYELHWEKAWAGGTENIVATNDEQAKDKAKALIKKNDYEAYLLEKIEKIERTVLSI